jgi:hypothetical protein
MAVTALISCVLLVGSLAPFPAAALLSTSESEAARAEEIAKLHKKYEDARDPVHRAKALVALGEAQVRDAGARLAAHDYPDAVAELQHYREEVVAVRKELAATGVDPERKPAGFRELQLSVRENLTRIEDIALAASANQQMTFVEVHEQLGQENDKLLTELFPTVPTGGTEVRAGHP